MTNEKDIQVLEDVEKTEFTENEVNQGMLETVTGEKILTVPGLGTVILRYPTRDDEMKADTERSRAFTNFLLDGLKTEVELQEIVEERGIWTKQHEDELEHLQEEMVQVRVEINEAKSGTKRKKLQKNLLDVRTKWVEVFSRKNAIFGHTVESKATNIYWQYLTYRCAFKEDGTRIWESYRAFLDEANSHPSTIVLTEFLTFYNGLSDNFFALWAGEETELPESGERDGE